MLAAVKCNDDSAVLQILADLGANFDCASKVCSICEYMICMGESFPG